MAESRKPVAFVGSSLSDLRAFPDEARSEAGHQISRVQLGLEPVDCKPMPTVGSGAYEIRIRDERAEAVFVLHCFQKKTQRTSQANLALAKKRYREMVDGQ